MIHGLVSGRVSGNIKSTEKYTAGRLIAQAGADVLTVGFIAFADDIRAVLDGLQNGDAVSLTGNIIPKAFTDRSGTNRATVSITATKVLVA